MDPMALIGLRWHERYLARKEAALAAKTNPHFRTVEHIRLQEVRAELADIRATIAAAKETE